MTAGSKGGQTCGFEYINTNIYFCLYSLHAPGLLLVSIF